MKKYILCLFAMLCVSMLCAQNYSRLNVVKLELVPNDTEASRAKKVDANREKCALLKIQTPNMDEAERNKLVIEADRGTFIYPAEAVGEIKIFLTEGVKTLIFKHPDYGVLKYSVNKSIEGNKVYELVLEADKQTSNPNPTIQLSSNYVNIKVVPQDAIISIDGQFYTKGNIKLSVDEPHELEVSHPLYHTYEKTIYASSDKKMSYDVKLAPAFGWLSITSKPENGATVLIDKKRVGVTPFRSDTLKSGEYEVTLLKDMYESVTKTVNVRDNNVGEIEIQMKPNFAEITINTDKDSDIYVDENKVGTGSWKGRLGEGQHIVEARKASHRSTKTAFDVTAGKPQTVAVTAPTPKYGALDITSEPDEATVYLDGKNIGETPLVQKNILIGSHTLKLEKQGCASLEKTVIVTENQIVTVDERLQTGKEISISTDGVGDKIFVDDNYVGLSPLTTIISYGEHNVTAVRGYNGNNNELNKIKSHNGVITANQTINVEQNDCQIKVHILLFDGKNKTYTVNGVSFEMVAVKGGTFTMGNDSKEAHSVTLSDYYIGKFEVTQELWQAVVGYNPSKFKGDNLPVESIGWGACQIFINELNRLTGINFRLPTEAEWEYAARGGIKSKGYKYSGSNNLGNVGWYYQNSGDKYLDYWNFNEVYNNHYKTHAVGAKAPNELGIYDMSGNVSEYCLDWEGDYSHEYQIDPTGPSIGSYKIVRGGDCLFDEYSCRVSSRSNELGVSTKGFRLVIGHSSIYCNSKGVFSISGTKQVKFSKGNLQYQASTKTWRFAEHQWDVIGYDNKNISDSYDGWIDLFGWGTGDNPTNNSANNDDYKTFNDWGANTILNGDDKKWRTLTKNEWDVLLNYRATLSSIRYAKAVVNGVNGLVLLPDDWNSQNYNLNDTNKTDAEFKSNIITQNDWLNKLEANGAIFLPAAGYRICKSNCVSSVGFYGYYWSSTQSDHKGGSSLAHFGNELLGAYYWGERADGKSVRLVCSAE